MSKIRSLVRASAAFALAGVALSCSHDAEVFMPEPADDMFRTYVAVGNSITAGVQSDGINDSTQQRSYALLLARQMRTRFAYPSLTMPGCRPPLTSFQTGARVGGTSAAACSFRSTSTATDILNNVAVPAHSVADAIAPVPFDPNNTLTTLILGGRTQIDRAIEANPTFVSVWLGGNDILQAAYTGLLTPVLGVSRGLTPLATFTQAYDNIAASLESGAPEARGLLVGVPNFPAVGLLFPAAALQSAQFLGGLNQAAGTGSPIVVSPNCTGSTSQISILIVTQMRAGTHERTISCEKTPTPTNPLLGDIWVLDSQEQATMTARVSDFNTHIQAKATQLDFAYADPNPTVNAAKTSGCLRAVPDLSSAAAPFGACVSLDGIHPSTATNVTFANLFIAAINTKYGTSLPAVP
ncbi:MAG: SGNH/GDSL hydrolase family protein [Gemmatimonadota bacterium]|nr:SGNH/GDSL hydrolase family protein [Gemmatimonadota bacterium]